MNGPDLVTLIEQIVSEVIHLGPAAQVAHIDQVCGANHALRRAVEEALEQHPDAEFWGSGAPLSMQGEFTPTEIRPPEARRVGPGSRLSHYLIEEKIGQGGMGEVYRARDLALGRAVAIKVLRDLVDPSLRARLAREARAGARLDHAAVATFIEFAHADGIDYLAMEFVEGENLRSVLRRGKLEVDTAIALVEALLEALVFAHSLGILHRDIKPENVMVLPDGSVKLLDFGVAKDVTLAEPATSKASARTVLETMHGAVVGTPGYMAPEQVRGEEATEASDVFALGALLHECLSGERTFHGASIRALMVSVLTDDAAQLHESGIPMALADIVQRALERDPGSRYANAREFLSALRRLEVGGSQVNLPKTIALLDLVNLRAEKEHDWIGSGVSESLSVDLRRVEGLEIVPRARVKQVLGGTGLDLADVDPAEVGLAVRARWVFAGSFQRSGDALRMTVRLIEVATDEELWTEKLDGTVKSVLEMQDELAVRVAASLGMIVPAAPSVGRNRELDAYESYQRALQLWGRFERGTVEEMFTHLERAIKLAPDYAEPLALMASTYAPSRWIQTTDPADLERCIEFAMRAIEANPELPGAHVALGYAYWRQGRLKDAIEEEETAARLDPDSFGDYFLGGCYSELGQYEEAAAASRRFHERVETPFNLHLLGFELMQLDRGVEARWALREGHRLALTPGGYQWQGVLTSLAEQLRREGDVARARASAMESLAWLERSDNIFRGTLRVQTLAGLGRTCLDEGDHRGAGAAFEQALALMEASPSGLGMGHLKVVCTAGLARVRRDAAMFERAVEFFEVRPSMNFGFLPVGCDVSTTCDLAHAASQFNEAGLAREYARRSEQLGMPVHLLP